MKIIILTIAFTCLIIGFTSAQVVSNVDFRSEGQYIVIFYSLSGDNNLTYFVEVFCSQDSGRTYGLALKAVTGDVGPGIKPGYNKTITWDVLSEKDALSGNIKFDVSATEELRIKKLTAFALGIPDDFTPSGKDLFKPDPNKCQGLGKHTISIYSKNGEKIWESINFPAGWDGKQNGNYVPAGSYLWKLEVSPGEPDHQIITGELLVFSPSIESLTVQKVKKNKPDEFTDARDEKNYKWVQIGNQTWMAENLNYNTSGASWCYNGKEVNCKTYGMLYDWESARTACPDGWHLPSEEEWDILIEFIGGKKLAGGKLKEAGSIHWAAPNQGATNEFGFNAVPGGLREVSTSLNLTGLPVGGRSQAERFKGQSKEACFWTSDKAAGHGAWYIELRNDEEKIYHTSGDRMSGISVRCLKN